MPTASQRGTTVDKGASTASNEMLVSTAENPNPPADPTVPPMPKPVLDDRQIIPGASKPRGANKAHGLDHPAESEHDHKHQKLKGTSAS